MALHLKEGSKVPKIKIKTEETIIIMNKKHVGVIRFPSGDYKINLGHQGMTTDKLKFKQIYKAMGKMLAFEKEEK